MFKARLTNALHWNEAGSYRRDIDGLRAIAVIAVIVFHLGWVPNGYLGVDVFFVISGYLITGIIIREQSEGRFTLSGFYMRRVRRILPLTSFIVTLALVVGVFTMLPDDLENLAQSVVATNVFANNVLQAITTRNYWDVVNEYKPLMHTWSLGVEEQFYLIYPLIFMALGIKNSRHAMIIVATLAAISFALFLSQSEEYRRFYYIQYRFYEIALGGMLALASRGRVLPIAYSGFWIAILVVLLCFDVPVLHPDARLILALLATCLVLASDNIDDRLSSLLLTNRVAIYLGLMSFSLYMWHQLIFAYARYFVVQKITPVYGVGLFAIAIALSILSYRYIEKPFRDRVRISNRVVCFLVGMVIAVSASAALAIHGLSGVIREVPELEITASDRRTGLHSEYNHRIHGKDVPFTNIDGIRVLVAGNSFARDWANVLMESRYSEQIVLSYSTKADSSWLERAAEADVIYVSTADREDRSLLLEAGVDMENVWSVGTKNFGENSGYFYNRRHRSNYCLQRVAPDKKILETNVELSAIFQPNYIDLLEAVLSDDGTVPVFTPECLLISQDTRHFTRAGAAYFAELFDADIAKQLGIASVGGELD